MAAVNGALQDWGYLQAVDVRAEEGRGDAGPHDGTAPPARNGGLDGPACRTRPAPGARADRIDSTMGVINLCVLPRECPLGTSLSSAAPLGTLLARPFPLLPAPPGLATPGPGRAAGRGEAAPGPEGEGWEGHGAVEGGD